MCLKNSIYISQSVLYEQTKMSMQTLIAQKQEMEALRRQSSQHSRGVKQELCQGNSSSDKSTVKSGVKQADRGIRGAFNKVAVVKQNEYANHSQEERLALQERKNGRIKVLQQYLKDKVDQETHIAEVKNQYNLSKVQNKEFARALN